MTPAAPASVPYRRRRFAPAALFGAAAAALAFGLTVAAPVARARQSGGAPRTAPPQVRFDLRLTRTEDAAPGGGTPAAAAPVVVGAPTLSTVSGQTASMSVSGTDPSFSVSLSPTVESGDNGQQTAAGGSQAQAPPPVASVQVAWSLRLSGKNLPAGVTGVTLTGATRVAAGTADVALAEVTLTDPGTARVSRFRLGGRVTVGAAATESPATSPAQNTPASGTNAAR